ncbi:uncharacterized protein N7503_000005 [Penicillium pulvis]|uniref:uncharacterized protein n=1 Tax=Penicillium pulvis TaxID=1562058 RepID=UPI002548781C|nr:uncharacterized protein N7503_000005 [Penicillium pulvis]KAJ5813255.1 hypothetical protein N7503_000005 [Penicillium pulvis]
MTAIYPEVQVKAIVVTAGGKCRVIGYRKIRRSCRRNPEAHQTGTSISLAADVTKADQVDTAIQQALSTFDRLDGAAIVAGIVGDRQVWDNSHGLENLKDADWDKIMRVNLDGVKNFLRAKFSAIKGPSAFVNAASISGHMANPSPHIQVANRE